MTEDIHENPGFKWGWPQDTGPLPILREIRGARVENAGEWRSFLTNACYRDTDEGRTYLCGHDWMPDEVFADLAEIRSRGYTVAIEGDAAPGSLIREPLIVLIRSVNGAVRHPF